MTDKPEALRLADECDEGVVDFAEAAAQLRRLHALNAELLEALEDVIADLEHEEADGWMSGQVHSDEYKRARAAIAKVKGEKQ